MSHGLSLPPPVLPEAAKKKQSVEPEMIRGSNVLNLHQLNKTLWMSTHFSDCDI